MRKLLTFAAVVMTSVAFTAVPAPAHAAPTWFYTAWTGATYVNVLNSTVSSDLTAQSAVSGTGDRTSSNSTAAVDVSKLVSVGAAQSTTSATNNGGSVTMKSWARTAGVKLLDGLITADALETTTTTVGNADGTAAAPTSDSKLLGLKITGVNVPINIPKNWVVTIPGVAVISANYSLQTNEKGLYGTRAWALTVQLLKARDGYQAGVTIGINPIAQYLQQGDPEAVSATVSGYSYSSRVQADVGDGVKVVSNPTALLTVPLSTSDGETRQNSTASASVPGLLTLGALKSTNVSNRDDQGNANVTATNQTAGLNLLGGLIKADAIQVSATGRYQYNAQTQKFDYTSEMKMTTVNLVIAGQAIPINVSPNTKIDIAGLGAVELNRQEVVPSSRANRIYGLRITLDTAKAGLPVGAVIELAVASTTIKAGSKG